MIVMIMAYRYENIFTIF